ncbi:hypothetical protein ScalyP_jg9148, partial [Parmales sp. scaly parma]
VRKRCLYSQSKSIIDRLKALNAGTATNSDPKSQAGLEEKMFRKAVDQIGVAMYDLEEMRMGLEI